MTPAEPQPPSDPPSDPTPAARRLGRTVDGADGGRQVGEATRDVVEKLTFATADEILAMLRDVLAEDWTPSRPGRQIGDPFTQSLHAWPPHGHHTETYNPELTGDTEQKARSQPCEPKRPLPVAPRPTHCDA
ncbi:hypothetical protein [Streptomyces sp. NPDC012616]|uniref:hypothetical protein n=1 Tax=Streptomyces sp. NPDC012616 TaxID=3364840 RepID=UPI0036F12CB4